MSSSSIDKQAVAVQVRISGQSLVVTLGDGRTISAPLGWYPRLQHGTPGERRRWSLIGGGTGIHWPLLDEDISVANLLSGAASCESDRSLAAWKARRGSGRNSRVRRRTGVR